VPGGEFAVGDRVLVRANDLRRGVVNGTRGRVVSVDPQRRRLTVECNGEPIILDAGFLDAYTVHGDPSLLHGYAITAHVAQGLTVDHAFVLADDGLDRELAYTALSRGRHSNRLYLARERVIRPVVAAADELLAQRGHQLLPDGVTAHKLRHTFASLLVALGNDPAYVMAQLGHADPKFTLRIYTHGMRRLEGDKERLQALVEGRDWAPLGTSAQSGLSSGNAEDLAEAPETRPDAGLSEDGRGWVRTSDLSRVKRALSH